VSKLLDAQCSFAQDVALLIQRAVELGLRVKGGEWLRPKELQELYVAQGRSWAPNSRHLDGLAIDLLLFDGDRYLTGPHDYDDLGAFWEGLRPENVWGAGGTGSTRRDANHFERRRPA
jgi:hypothetical protein